MNAKAKAAIQKDIVDRLDDIAFHYEERDRLCLSLSSYTRADSIGSGQRRDKYERVIKRIKSEEDNMLLKLVHLKDSVDKYLVANGSNLNEIKVVDLFKPYRIASNYVNIRKHGIRGKNAKTAIHDYTCYFFRQDKEEPAGDDHFVGLANIINFEGELYQSLDIILDLIRIWELFLRNHTEIGTDKYYLRICNVQSRLKDLSTYSTPVPKGMLADAMHLATERKSLDIE